MKNSDIMDLVSRLSRLSKRRPAESHKLSRGPFSVLKVLEKAGEMNLSELAEELDIRASSLSETLARMEHHNLIVREKDEGDSRVVRISASEKGLEHLKQHAEVFSELEKEIGEVLSEEEIQKFKETCSKLIEFFEKRQPWEGRRHGGRPPHRMDGCRRHGHMHGPGKEDK